MQKGADQKIAPLYKVSLLFSTTYSLYFHSEYFIHN